MTLYCRKCDCPERALNLKTGKIRNVSHGDSVRSLLCSDCVAQGFIERNGKKKEGESNG